MKRRSLRRDVHRRGDRPRYSTVAPFSFTEYLPSFYRVFVFNRVFGLPKTAPREGVERSLMAVREFRPSQGHVRTKLGKTR